MAEVEQELAALLSEGVVVDIEKVVALFLNKGVDRDHAERKAHELWHQNHDTRFLAELRGLGNGEAWRTVEGFLLHIGDCLVWERCAAGTATYILPDRRAVAGEDLTVEEWASVLGRVLPAVNKMDLRYGPAGQSLSGTEEGVAFVIHAKADNGEFEGWLDAVRSAVERDQTQAGDIPTLDEILMLGAGDE